MSRPINYDLLPEGLRDGMRLYIEHGVRPGRFLEAALKDSLTGAFGQADENNRARMFDIACFLYNEMPMTAWGSPEVVEGWIRANRAKAEQPADSRLSPLSEEAGPNETY